MATYNSIPNFNMLKPFPLQATLVPVKMYEPVQTNKRLISTSQQIFPGTELRAQ